MPTDKPRGGGGGRKHETDAPAGGARTGREHREHEHRREGAPPVRDANAPRTTTGPLTAPKFGSAGSGGAELEPGPEKP